MKLLFATLAGITMLGSAFFVFQETTEPEKPAVPDSANSQPPAKQAPVSPDLATLVEGNNEFAFDLYHLLADKPGNKFFSPYSISTALGMTLAGARGTTAREMAQTLHFTLPNERLHVASGQLIHNINGPNHKRSYELAVANSLWGDKSLVLASPFLRLTQTDYQAGFQSVDFIGDPDGSRRQINGWVEDRTNKKIKELLTEDVINSNTRLVLANAIYFKGDWSVPFRTAPGWLLDFTIPGQTAVKVPMMAEDLVVNNMANDDYQLAQLMYKDNEVSMIVILPKKKDGLPEVERKLSAKSLAESLGKMRKSRLNVILPKFKMTEEFRLEKDLPKLGMKEAFSPGADFSGMTDSPNGLFISAVCHKAFVKVDEKGTEAAAATGVVMTDKEPPEFRADHPFLFLIRHNATGSILFIGRVFDPRDQPK